MRLLESSWLLLLVAVVAVSVWPLFVSGQYSGADRGLRHPPPPFRGRFSQQAAWLDSLNRNFCGSRKVSKPSNYLRSANRVSLAEYQRNITSRCILKDILHHTWAEGYGRQENPKDPEDEYQVRRARKVTNSSRRHQRIERLRRCLGSVDRVGWGKIAERVSVGYRAYAGEYPWFVLVLTMDAGKSGSFHSTCGGVIIHRNLILTAAHCMSDGETGKPVDAVRVVAGYFDDEDKTTRQVIDGEAWLVDSNYGSNDGSGEILNRTDNDIAVIKLDRELQFTQYVQPACLPSNSHDPLPQENCYLAGHGLTDGDREPDHLLAMPMRQCSTRFFLDETCYSSADTTNYPGSPCHGDSGSGIMCPDNPDLGDRARFYAVAITSWGRKRDCARGIIEQISFSDLRKQNDRLLDMAARLLQ